MKTMLGQELLFLSGLNDDRACTSQASMHARTQGVHG